MGLSSFLLGRFARRSGHVAALVAGLAVAGAPPFVGPWLAARNTLVGAIIELPAVTAEQARERAERYLRRDLGVVCGGVGPAVEVPGGWEVVTYEGFLGFPARTVHVLSPGGQIWHDTARDAAIERSLEEIRAGGPPPVDGAPAAGPTER